MMCFITPPPPLRPVTRHGCYTLPRAALRTRIKRTQAYLYRYKLQLISAQRRGHQSPGSVFISSGAKGNNTGETVDGDPAGRQWDC